MDLSDETAQHVLNKAICIDDRIYGVYNDTIYRFVKTNGNVYHGFRDDDISDDDKKRIYDKYKARREVL